MEGFSVGRAAALSGWSARMLRYLERAGLVIPARTTSGYRTYGIRELNQLRGLSDLRRRFGVELDEVAFALKLRREPALRAAVETWLAGTDVPSTGASAPDWVEWEQRKHEKLLVA
jgi:MerR family transcriptional regulator, copper efflux regulator